MRLSKQLLVGLVVVIGMLFAGLSPALAAPPSLEDSQAIEFTGKVVAISQQSATLQVEAEVDDGTVVYTVHVPSGFDFASVSTGNVVKVTGTLIAEKTVQATQVVKVTEGPGKSRGKGPKNPTPTSGATPTAGPSATPKPTEKPKEEDKEDKEDKEDSGEGKAGSHFCGDSDQVHPLAQGIAETYGVSYDKVMEWFCQGKAGGFGQIMLALQTAEITGKSADTYLDRRAAGEGWGKIWKDLGLTGKDRKAGKPKFGEDGTPSATGQPKQGGKPDVTRQPKENNRPDKPTPSGTETHRNSQGKEGGQGKGGQR